MAATELHQEVAIEAAQDLSEAQRIHRRNAICAMPPQPSLVPFEHMVTQYLASEANEAVLNLGCQVALLRESFFASKDQDEEDVWSIALHAKREELQQLLNEDQAA